MNGELHLPPLAVLRERGMLDRTIRRELVQLMTEDILAGQPLWVRGAAICWGSHGGTNAVQQRPSFSRASRVMRKTTICFGRYQSAR